MCKHCWDDTESVHHKDFIQGAVDPEDFYDEVNYHQKKKDRKARPRRGCYANDFGAHVYVWTTELEPVGWAYSLNGSRVMSFYSVHGFHRMEAKVCVGCQKVIKRRYTEEFNKLAAKEGWYHASYGWRRY